MKVRKRERRDLLIMLVILLLGFLCILLTSGWALRFAPRWELTADMNSLINPDSEFPNSGPGESFVPIDPAILTDIVPFNIYLTPGSSFATWTALPTQPPTEVMIPTSTIMPVTNTSLPPSPTNTFIYYPPPPTRTPRPKPIKTKTPTLSVTDTSTITTTPPNTPTITLTPSNTPVTPPSADLAITKTDAITSYNPGQINQQTTYSIVVRNNGPSAVVGAVITDNIPSPQIASWSWTCAQSPGAAGCSPMPTSSANFTNTVDLASGASIIYTVTADISSAASGNITNTANVSLPLGYTDPVPGNNSAQDTDVPIVPLSLACFTSPVTIGTSGIYPVSAPSTCFRYQNPNPTFGGVFTIQELSGSIGALTWFGRLNSTDITCSTYPQNMALPANGTVTIAVQKLPSSNDMYVEISGTTSVQINIADWLNPGPCV